MHLIDFLRDELGLTGSHVGCEHGVCGACTVRVDGEIVRGCLMLAVQANGCKVDTIEGLSDSGELAELQKAFHEQQRAAVRLLHAGHADGGAGPAASRAGSRRATRSARTSRATTAAAPATRRSWTRSRRCSAEWAKAELPAARARAPQTDKGYIGQSVPRPNAQRLLQGRGAFVDDLRFPRLAHVVFFRSPYAHARIKKLDFDEGAQVRPA